MAVYGTFCCVSRTPDLSLTERDMATLRAFTQLAAQLIESDLACTAATRRSPRGSRVLADDAITIVHQPIHELLSGKPVGVECLARFPDAALRGPECGSPKPPKSGWGSNLSSPRSALRCARRHVPAPCYMSINASPETVIRGDLLALVQGHDRARLVIEVTEHSRSAIMPRWAPRSMPCGHMPGSRSTMSARAMPGCAIWSIYAPIFSSWT